MRGSTFKRCACRDENGKQLGKSCPKLGGKRHGSWYFVTSVPGADGRRRQMKRGGFATKGDAEQALDDIVGKARRGERIDDKLTVAQWLEFWLSEKTKPTGSSAAGKKIRPSTGLGYRHHMDHHLIPELGHIPLSKLTAEDISAAYDAVQARKPHLSPRSMQLMHRTLSAALARAVKSRRISYNPASHVDIAPVTRPQVNPWQPAELGKFLDHIVTHELGALFETIAATGMRRGEALGLRWRDLDLENGIIVVRQQLMEVKKGGEKFGSPKSEAGEHRVIELDGHTMDILRARRFAQDLERAEWGAAYDEHDLVFAHPDGTPYRPSTITKAFIRLSAEAGVRRVRLHDLRHGAASLMLAAGVPIEVVSKRLGHANITLTMDTYSHLLEGVGREAAERAQALVPRAQAPAVRSHNVTTSTGEADVEDTEPTALPSDSSEKTGGPRRTRTDNPRIKSPLLCQLS